MRPQPRTGPAPRYASGFTCSSESNDARSPTGCIETPMGSGCHVAGARSDGGRNFDAGRQLRGSRAGAACRRSTKRSSCPASASRTDTDRRRRSAPRRPVRGSAAPRAPPAGSRSTRSAVGRQPPVAPPWVRRRRRHDRNGRDRRGNDRRGDDRRRGDHCGHAVEATGQAVDGADQRGQLRRYRVMCSSDTATWATATCDRGAPMAAAGAITVIGSGINTARLRRRRRARARRIS